MNQSTRTKLLAKILPVLVLVTLSIKPVSSVSCKVKNPFGFCLLEKVSIQTDDEASNFIFPYERIIHLSAPSILWSSSVLFRRLPDSVGTLEINNGFVPEVYIKSTLYAFKAQRNRIRNVIIDEDKTYPLKFLGILNNHLRSIPENITKLTNLGGLNLFNNEIEAVNMDQFQGLIRLEFLNLANNRIARMDTSGPLNLPSLLIYVLSENALEELSIKFWNFPNIRAFHLSHNKLRKIEGFPENFPSMNETSFNYNRWSCTWLSDKLQKPYLWSKIAVQRHNEQCPKKNFRGVCCEDSLEDVNFFLAKLQRAVEQIEEKVSKLIDSNE